MCNKEPIGGDSQSGSAENQLGEAPRGELGEESQVQAFRAALLMIWKRKETAYSGSFQLSSQNGKCQGGGQNNWTKTQVAAESRDCAYPLLHW